MPMGMQPSMKRIASLIVCALAMTAVPAAAKQAPVEVTPEDALYPVLIAYHEGSVELGSTVGGCRMAPLADCPGAKLGGRKLTGAILPSSNLNRLSARGAGMVGAIVSLSNLRGADLRKVDAPTLVTSYANLERSDLSGATLTLGGLAKMKARGASFRGANLHAADLSGADLRRADLRRAQLSGVLAAGTDLRGADLRGADLALADFHKADLRGARLAGARFCSTIMPSGRVRARSSKCHPPVSHGHGPPIAIPPEVDLYTVLKATTGGAHAKPPGTKVRGCAIGPSAVCPGGDIRGANLHAAFLSYARFPRADFRHSHLDLGNLSFANLRGAQFQRSVLAGAAGVETDFTHSSMTAANLTLADFVGARLVRTDLRRADARSSNLTRADLRQADLRRARLGSAALVGADLRGAALAGAELSEAILLGARLSGPLPVDVTLCNTVMPDGSVANPASQCES